MVMNSGRQDGFLSLTSNLMVQRSANTISRFSDRDLPTRDRLHKKWVRSFLENRSTSDQGIAVRNRLSQ